MAGHVGDQLCHFPHPLPVCHEVNTFIFELWVDFEVVAAQAQQHTGAYMVQGLLRLKMRQAFNIWTRSRRLFAVRFFSFQLLTQSLAGRDVEPQQMEFQ